MTRPTHCHDCARTLIPKRFRGPTPTGMGRHHGRGLCAGCYWQRKDKGTLTQVDRVTRSRDELLAEWEHLHSEGYTIHQAEERLGMAYASLERALQRARKVA